MSSALKSDINKIFGKILRDARKTKKMTQEELAERLGISLKYISRIENGNNGVKTQTLIRYMNILGITPNTIYASFITNEEAAKNVEISEKIVNLSDEKKDFINAIIDLLENLEEKE